MINTESKSQTIASQAASVPPLMYLAANAYTKNIAPKINLTAADNQYSSLIRATNSGWIPSKIQQQLLDSSTLASYNQDKVYQDLFNKSIADRQVSIYGAAGAINQRNLSSNVYPYLKLVGNDICKMTTSNTIIFYAEGPGKLSLTKSEYEDYRNLLALLADDDVNQQKIYLAFNKLVGFDLTKNKISLISKNNFEPALRVTRYFFTQSLNEFIRLTSDNSSANKYNIDFSFLKKILLSVVQLHNNNVTDIATLDCLIEYLEFVFFVFENTTLRGEDIEYILTTMLRFIELKLLSHKELKPHARLSQVYNNSDFRRLKLFRLTLSKYYDISTNDENEDVMVLSRNVLKHFHEFFNPCLKKLVQMPAELYEISDILNDISKKLCEQPAEAARIMDELAAIHEEPAEILAESTNTIAKLNAILLNLNAISVQTDNELSDFPAKRTRYV